MGEGGEAPQAGRQDRDDEARAGRDLRGRPENLRVLRSGDSEAGPLRAVVPGSSFAPTLYRIRKLRADVEGSRPGFQGAVESLGGWSPSEPAGLWHIRS